MKKVKLKINRVVDNREIKSEVLVNDKMSKKEAKDFAQLKFLNEYINRDCNIGLFTNVTETKRVAKLKIKATYVE